MIVTPQGSVALVRACPPRWGPLEIGEVPNEGEEPVIGDVERSELGGLLALLRLPIKALLTLVLAALLFRLAFGGRLATLSGYHYSLRGGPNVVFQCGELICPTI